MDDDIEEQEDNVSRKDFDSIYEYIDYISFGSCGSCTTGRFYVLLGAIGLGIINLVQFMVILFLLL